MQAMHSTGAPWMVTAFFFSKGTRYQSWKKVARQNEFLDLTT